MHQGLSQVQAAPHPAGESTRSALCHVLKIHNFQQLIRLLLGLPSRDVVEARLKDQVLVGRKVVIHTDELGCVCLLYTSDAADDLLCVDLGGRRIIKKKKKTKQNTT